MCVCVCGGGRWLKTTRNQLWGEELVPFQGPWTGQLSPAPAQFHPSALRAMCVCVCVEEITHSQEIVC